MTGAPAGFQGMGLTVRPWLDGRTYLPHTKGTIFTGGSGSLTVKYPAEFGSMLQTILSIGSPDIELRLLRRMANPPASLSLTSGDLPPTLSNAALDKATPSRPVLSFQGDTSGADGVVMHMNYAPDGTTIKSWTVAVQPGKSAFIFPELPASLAALAPTAATTYSGIDVVALSSPSIAGNDDFRQHHVLQAQLYSVLPPIEEVSVAIARKQNP